MFLTLRQLSLVFLIFFFLLFFSFFIFFAFSQFFFFFFFPTFGSLRSKHIKARYGPWIFNAFMGIRELFMSLIVHHCARRRRRRRYDALNNVKYARADAWPSFLNFSLQIVYSYNNR